METEQGAEEVGPQRLHELGVSPAVAFDRALDWLSRTTGPPELKPVDTVPGMFFVQSSAGQVASRLAVLPELFERMPLGGILAAVPSGNQLLCVPVDSVASVNALRILASAVGTAYEHATHPVSDQLFWYDGATWQVVHIDRSESDITVLPPRAFFARMRQVASMDLVRVAGEA